MTERKRLVVLILIMAGVSLAVAAIAIYVLYGAAFDEASDRLVETAHSQARLVEAIARFDSVHAKDLPGGHEAATLSQIIDAHAHYEGFGDTGEFTLARREGEEIVFVLSHRHHDLKNPKPVPWKSEIAEPMRRALAGNSGTCIALDYRGQSVLAAHEPVSELDMGIVAKIDLAEVRAPFVTASLVALGSTGVVVVLGSLLFVYVSNPMIRRLKESNEDLEDRVRERTRELSDAQEQLVRQERLATLGQLAGGVAHEIRNPMGVIRNAAYFLQQIQDDTDEDAKDALGEISRGLANSERIVSELLDYARGPKTEPSLFPLDEAVTAALEMVRMPGNVQVERPEPFDTRVNADRGQVERLLANLIQNATQAMPKGGTLTVRCDSVNGSVVTEVTDTGVGIAEEELEKVFEPLFTKRAKGIGLGLPLCQRYADLNGGSLSVESKFGEGSTFRVTLPLTNNGA